MALDAKPCDREEQANSFVESVVITLKPKAQQEVCDAHAELEFYWTIDSPLDLDDRDKEVIRKSLETLEKHSENTDPYRHYYEWLSA